MENQQLENIQPVPAKRRPWLWGVVLFVIIFGGIVCYSFFRSNSSISSSKTNEITQSDATSTDITESSSASNYFGLNLLKKISLEEDNIFVSPTSISSALALAANGAEGQTLDEMLKVLGLDQVGLNTANADYKTKMKKLNTSSDTLNISIANSIWTTGGSSFLPAYQDLAKNVFDAKADKASSVNDINGWVESKTNGKIKNILNYLQSDLYLVNAIYFKGDWSSPFETADTQKESFQTRTTQTDVDMMNKTEILSYYSDSKVQVVKLPYRSDNDQGQYSMVVYLPAKSSTLADLIKSLDYKKYQNYITNLSDAEVELKLPKFELDYKTDLVEKLNLLGMQRAFGKQGELTKMSSIPQFISEVIHQSYIKVDEKGTEAAAATVVGTLGTAMITEEPETVKMYVNRPFFFSIQDDETGEMLFSGAIQDPSK